MRPSLIALPLALFSLAPTSAIAAVVSRTVNFTASRFEPISTPGLISPYQSISGSFTAVFEDSSSEFFGASGLTVNALDFTMDPGLAVGFQLDKFPGSDRVTFGGFGGGNLVGLLSSTSDDFRFSVSGFLQGPPYLSSFGYSDKSTNQIYDARLLEFKIVENAVPEPGTWAMMILGFGAIGVAMRRRRTGAGRFLAA